LVRKGSRHGMYWGRSLAAALIETCYWILKLIPSTRVTGKNLDTVTINQIVKALVDCIKNPPAKNNIVDVQAMKRFMAHS
jgi:hypothetical protein